MPALSLIDLNNVLRFEWGLRLRPSYGQGGKIVKDKYIVRSLTIIIILSRDHLISLAAACVYRVSVKLVISRIICTLGSVATIDSLISI